MSVLHKISECFGSLRSEQINATGGGNQGLVSTPEGQFQSSGIFCRGGNAD